MKRKLPYLALALCVVQGLLVLLAWMLTAINPHIALRSPLSPEGLRWLFGRYTYSLATPVLAWLVLGVMAYGTVTDCGIWRLLRGGLRAIGVRERFAMRVVMGEAVMIVLVMLLLTAMPQAVLLSVTGGLWPSSFAYCLLPVICFSVMGMGITYGLMAGRYRNLDDIFRGLSSGFASSGSLFVLWVLVSMVWHTVCYVFFP